MFSGIDSRCVPRAQVRVRAGGRSGSAIQLSTPAVSACTQRSVVICGSNPGGAPQASIASVSARCACVGVSLRGSDFDGDSLGEAGGLDGFHIGAGRVGPEENAGRMGHEKLPICAA